MSLTETKTKSQSDNNYSSGSGSDSSNININNSNKSNNSNNSNNIINNNNMNNSIKVKKIITKSLTTTKGTTNTSIINKNKDSNDPIIHLPPDLSVKIIDQLTDRDIRYLPQVHPRWASLFYNSYQHPTIDSIFRSLVRHRYQVPFNFLKSSSYKNKSWGHLYLTLRRERCHLCPNHHILPFAYAASPNLSVALFLFPNLILFPICFSCFYNLTHCHCCHPSSNTNTNTNTNCRNVYIPVIEYNHTALNLIFSSYLYKDDNNSKKIDYYKLINEKSDLKLGYQYSDLSTSISYVLARPIYNKLLSSILSTKAQQPDNQE